MAEDDTDSCKHAVNHAMNTLTALHPDMTFIIIASDDYGRASIATYCETLMKAAGVVRGGYDHMIALIAEAKLKEDGDA